MHIKKELSCIVEERDEEMVIPKIITNHSNNTQYLCGRFLGKGGYAECYEFIDLNTNQIFAGKIVSKRLHGKKELNIFQEIAIHRDLNHTQIVEFHSFFEDKTNIYIIIELCRGRTLLDLLQRRKVITELETCYYMIQIVLACQYLHENKIIHRDLKLENILLDDNLNLKVIFNILT